jgi:anti-sigma factor RsiW
MNAHATQCPSDAVLSDFGLGKLDAARAETVARHVESCPDCQRRVSSVSGGSVEGRPRLADNPAPKRGRTYVPGESLANSANSTDGSLEDGPPRPSRNVAVSESVTG